MIDNLKQLPRHQKLLPCVHQVERLIMNALYEDIGSGDVTTSSIVSESHRSTATIISKDEFILAGIPFAEMTFKILDSKIRFDAKKTDGGKVKRGDIIAVINGRTRSLLMAERTALNILQRLSGVATLTHRYVERIKGLHVRIVDTRKTIPGLRFLDKYAVRVGGGSNHRFGLYDGILIKDNHIAVAGGIKDAVRLARANAHHLLRIEVEAKNLDEVKDAIKAGVDVIMLDNMKLKDIKKAVDFIRKRSDIKIEASGGVGLDNIRQIAETGVDYISIGAITHSATSPDISMEIEAL
ncbi:MAG: carboxylating nicotinate-nucleotide diphosphorylase [Thermodesulfovibrionia bacterium]